MKQWVLRLYYSVLAAGLLCRIAVKLWFMDVQTGFYAITEGGAGGSLPGFFGTFLIAAFNLALIAVPLTALASALLKSPHDDYPVYIKSRLTNALALATGIAVVAFAVAGYPESMLEQARSPGFIAAGRYACMALGMLSGIAFLHLGAGGVFGRDRIPAGVLVAVPAVWQVVLLIVRFNGYTTVTAISDHLLVVLFMLSSAMFLVGQARTLCMHMRKDGRNYTIPTGLCSAMFGIFLVVPNYVYMLVNKSPTPVLLLGNFESVYILALSLYQLSFVTGLARCIKKV